MFLQPYLTLEDPLQLLSVVWLATTSIPLSASISVIVAVSKAPKNVHTFTLSYVNAAIVFNLESLIHKCIYSLTQHLRRYFNCHVSFNFISSKCCNWVLHKQINCHIIFLQQCLSFFLLIVFYQKNVVIIIWEADGLLPWLYC